MDSSTSKSCQEFPRPWLHILAVACLVFFLAEFTYAKHPHVRYEHYFGFYTWIAAIATLALAVIGVLMRPLIWRDEEYYDG